MLLVVFTREVPLRGLGLPLVERSAVLAMPCTTATQWENASFFELHPLDGGKPLLVHAAHIAAMVDSPDMADWKPSIS